jgi:hypothetical protein
MLQTVRFTPGITRPGSPATNPPARGVEDEDEDGGDKVKSNWASSTGHRKSDSAMWEASDPSREALKQAIHVASYDRITDPCKKFENWASGSVIMTESERRKDDAVRSGGGDTTDNNDVETSRGEDDDNSSPSPTPPMTITTNNITSATSATNPHQPSSHVAVGDVYIRKFIRMGEAMFRVVSMDPPNDDSSTPPTPASHRMAYNEEDVGIRVSDLSNSSKYELLYRGDGEDEYAEGSVPGTPATPSTTPQPPPTTTTPPPTTI